MAGPLLGGRGGAELCAEDACLPQALPRAVREHIFDACEGGHESESLQHHSCAGRITEKPNLEQRTLPGECLLVKLLWDPGLQQVG